MEIGLNRKIAVRNAKNMEDSGLAEEFSEFSSEIRLAIIASLSKKKSTLSELAKLLEITAPEAHRNLGRLEKKKLIEKNSDGRYILTLYGRTIHAQIPTIQFMVKNKKYFEDHDFDQLPLKYIQRIGALAESNLISGYSKVTEKWENIYKNAQKYIYNILIDIPYNEKILDTLHDKLDKKVRILSIFSEAAVIPDKRQELLTKYNFAEFVRDDILQKKMVKTQKISLVLNEKEAGISFPSNDESDISKMFYSQDRLFHEWCEDFFMDTWNNSTAFQEAKIKR